MPAEQRLLQNISHAARDLSTCFDAHLKGMGLTAARAKVLLLLSRNREGVSQAGITDFLRVEHPTTVRILDGLENLGHVKRMPTPNDRRAKVIVLTEAGRPLADEVVILTERLNAILMEKLDPEDVANANRLLGTLLSNLAVLKSAGVQDPSSGEVEQ